MKTIIQKITDYNFIMRNISYRLRKKVTGKFVIIESDDWGLERAKDFESVKRISEKYGEDKCSRWTWDALESVQDMDMLFDLCQSFEGRFINAPVVTANFITHNIDYSSNEKLKFKPISEGYNFSDSALFEKYREGLSKKYFVPQLHGYSHFNTKLLEKDFYTENFVEDFEFGFSVAKSTIKGNLSLYRAECFDPNFRINIEKATDVFFKTFGYYSKTFIPSNYLYSDKLNSVLVSNGIELLQSSAHFLSEKSKTSIRPYYRKNNGLFYSNRNARLDVHNDYNFLAEHCINQIENAFLRNMPAVIDIHRVNFSGTYSNVTRLKTIEELNKVFIYLSKKHPETIFISSDEFVEVLKSKSF